MFSPAALLFGLSATAATIPVGPGETYERIGDAIAASSPGDVLELAPATYTECVDLSGRELTMQGAGAATDTVLDGSGCAEAVLSDADTVASLSGLTLTNTSGLGLRVVGGAVTLDDVVITGCGADTLDGGGISVSGASLSISGSTLHANLAARGGAIFASDATVALEDTEISDNHATLGGAVYADTTDGLVRIELGESRFLRDLADEEGGAIYLEEGGAILGSGGLFEENEAGRGGAVHASRGGSIELEATEISSNIASEHGGAIYGREGLQITLVGASLSSNQATYGSGGAVYIYGGADISLFTMQITGNSAWEDGGALYLEYNSQLSIDDSDVSDNSALYGDGGAVFQSFYGNIDITDTDLARNAARTGGGALYLDFLVGNARFDTVSFTENEATAGYGGAILGNDYQDLDIAGAVFSSNQAAYSGGALYLTTAGNVAISETDIEDNTAVEGDGAGIYLASLEENTWDFSLDQVLLQRNMAGWSGGGVYVADMKTVTVNDSTLNENVADVEGNGFSGGALYVANASAVLSARNMLCGNAAHNGGAVYSSGVDDERWTQSYLIENQASVAGGGIYAVNGAALSMINNTILGNSAVEGGGVSLNAVSAALTNNLVATTSAGDGLWGDDESAAVLAFTYNDLWENLDKDAGGSLSVGAGGDGNLSVDPMLRDYSQDGRCDNDDLDLAASSALIDAGDPSIYDEDCTRSDIGATGGVGDGTDCPDTGDDSGDTQDTGTMDTDTGITDDTGIGIDPGKGGCGRCQSSGTGGLWSLGLAALALTFRRRRALQSPS